MAAPDGAVDRLAALLEYPSATFAAELAACRGNVAALTPEVISGLERFAAAVDGLSTTALQERYTETFDFSAACTLDIGWHLYGERYERGVFLSELRPQLANAGIAEASELPDYLPRVLVLVDRLGPARGAALRPLVARAVATLIAALGERGSPYAHLVASAFAAASGGA
jgi:nitrate reductase delta subunit